MWERRVALSLGERQHIGGTIDAAVVVIELADTGIICQYERQLMAETYPSQ